ncbi:dihydrolipoyllysine-residue acetyltransferase [Legionella tunisiensis]|uniref:dihydrolipoyllysine-residue acetyltransferase n=1 Tax=Legionella tunisiensis TaxID=1034944 RepID=UPI00031B700B|nr:dihydrolipoyllysine-residue acetyltransferase [Legionella tunisiensis]
MVSLKSQTISQRQEVCIPDIGGATDVDVIEIMVKPGQSITKDQSLITLEGDKATMDIPSPAAGVIDSIALKVGDKVSQGALILVLNAEQINDTEVQSSSQLEEPAPEKTVAQPAVVSFEKSNLVDTESAGTTVSAGPAVRRLARELGVNLNEVKGSGRKSRVMKEDVQAYVKARLSEKPSTGGFALPSAPAIDFSKFGEIDVKPLNKIKRLTGVNVHRSWITIPHVTQFDEADITELETFRKSEAEHAKQSGFKLTMLAFVTKVVSKALAVYPQFNASLDASGENLIYKRYCHIGIAVETPNGLVVPVIKDVDRLTVSGIAAEMARLSAKARDKGLMPADMNGGCFTISSLGGIGGTAFTPIVNSPEVAILGLSRSSMKPVYDKGEFKPRLMLPLSLSYDHRVIDGAEAARFTRFIADSLSDIRRILL